jgi:hypothetical protein
MAIEHTGDGRIAPDDPGQGPGGLVPDLGAINVVGVFDTHEGAEAAVAELQREGFPAEAISVVRRPAGTPPEVGAEDTEAGSGTVAGASVGALVGGAVGLAALAVPGIGPLLAAGPVAAALSGALTGGALGALAGSMVGLGVPKERAEQYETAVRAGGVLVTVGTPNQVVAGGARETLARHGARDVADFQPSL